ncbi:hypothetical protein BJV82DRAFT_675344 [Fennellomyces sp. T-0311]|nr:hypothetical protein BJV82DRAFT_675344 [Fennellomyces sp. T-0311]
MSTFTPNLDLQNMLPFHEAEDQQMQDIFREAYDVMEGQVDIEDQYQIIVDEFNEETRRTYTDKDIVHLIDTIQEFTLSAAAAAPIALMSVRFAQRKQQDPTLLQQHTHHLEQLYDKDPTATLAQAQELLLRVYNVKITQSGLQKHLVKHCGLTMKKIEPVFKARNSPQTIKARFNWALDITKRGLLYENIIFIDEAGFNM